MYLFVPPWYPGLAADRSLPRAPPDHRLKQLNNNRLGMSTSRNLVTGPTYFWNSQGKSPKNARNLEKFGGFLWMAPELGCAADVELFVGVQEMETD